MTTEMLLTGMQIFISFANICILLYALYKFLNRPHDTLEQRVISIETEVKDIKESLHQGNDRFRSQEDTNEVLIHSVLALIEFEIQYCLTEHKEMSKDLEKAKEDLHSYLARK